MVQTETKEFIAPSGDKYLIRRLTYREKKIIQSKALKTQAIADDKNVAEKIATFDSAIASMESAWRCIVEAPWLQKGKKCTEEDLDNIKAEDGEELDKFIDEFNYPKQEIVEK